MGPTQSGYYVDSSAGGAPSSSYQTYITTTADGNDPVWFVMPTTVARSASRVEMTVTIGPDGQVTVSDPEEGGQVEELTFLGDALDRLERDQ